MTREFDAFAEIVASPQPRGFALEDATPRLQELGLVRDGYGFWFLSDYGVGIAYAMGLINPTGRSPSS